MATLRRKMLVRLNTRLAPVFLVAGVSFRSNALIKVAAWMTAYNFEFVIDHGTVRQLEHMHALFRRAGFTDLDAALNQLMPDKEAYVLQRDSLAWRLRA